MSRLTFMLFCTAQEQDELRIQLPEGQGLFSCRLASPLASIPALSLPLCTDPAELCIGEVRTTLELGINDTSTTVSTTTRVSSTLTTTTLTTRTVTGALAGCDSTDGNL